MRNAQVDERHLWPTSCGCKSKIVNAAFSETCSSVAAAVSYLLIFP